jgi:hypothetical protein
MMHQGMMQMQHRMMGHMTEHMPQGMGGGMKCPMMERMGEDDAS